MEGNGIEYEVCQLAIDMIYMQTFGAMFFLIRRKDKAGKLSYGRLISVKTHLKILLPVDAFPTHNILVYKLS